jgi:hypothetical protein
MAFDPFPQRAASVGAGKELNQPDEVIQPVSVFWEVQSAGYCCGKLPRGYHSTKW